MKQAKIQICLFIVLLAGLTGCGSTAKKAEVTNSPEPSVSYEQGADFVGAVGAVDEEQGTMEFYNTTFQTMETYPYTGGTQILTKNNKQMTASEIEPGEVYDVYTSEDGKKVEKMIQNASVTEHEGASLEINQDEKRLTVRGVNYAYNDDLLVFSDGRQIDPLEITPEDEVTLRGMNGQAFSVVVTRGHGYIKPTGYKDFLGGTLTVEGEAIVPVSKEMLLMVPEGQQKMSMVNGDLTGEVEVQVKRGQVTKVDMKKYQSQMPDTARVTFEIQPQGAELYVNGSLTDYSKKVPLKYGNHFIKVVLEGYNDYSGVVTIKDAGPTIRINLAEQEAQVDSSDGSSSDSSVSSDSDSSSSQSEQEKTDTDHKITVSAPAGAAVYINGTYKGVAPCSFTKVIGSVTLTLTKEGCTTKSYSVTITDDAQDVSWSFPDLEAASSQG